ncbi:hypothetical protein [Actinomycetospora lemnae]|uniref:Toprim domain-containing protein n=1 Tax=Actinomycetospora lemnae TaxID=3019891 RepID=A0ABT5SRL4_9PSEU|nr:hypothetical protein [Actinomycetospora sp. DW7H6]MDD7965502.1 hypothetical protein [Actinomycetospora sp. DW7H6]
MTDTEVRTTSSPTTRVPSRRSSPGAPTPSPEHWLGEVLAAMGCRRAGRKWQCPAHGHTGLHSAALAIGRRDDDRGAWLHCHAGCSISAVLRALGLRPNHLQRPPRITPSRYVRLRGLRREWPELRAAAHRETAGYRHEAWHLYGPDHAKQRLRRADGSKTMRWESRNARGEWVPGLLGTREVDLPLYREDEVRMAAAAGESVVLCESESSCDALHGVYATTWAGGAGSPPIETLTRVLEGTDVVIVPDHDDPGLACLDRLVAALPHARVLVGEPGEDAMDLYGRVGLDCFLEQLASARTAEPRGERQDFRSHAG